MLPTGHIATGLLLGLRQSRHRHGAGAGAVLAGSVACSILPDADLVIPALLDRLGLEHRLESGRHHSWMTHTPLFWGLVCRSAWRGSRHRSAPGWAPEAARLLSTGVALHLAGDATANTVALLWPLRRREYGLGLDRLPEVTDHLEYIRRYPASPAGRLEAALILAAGLWSLARARGGGRASSTRLA
jgi:hypothetical protein